MELADLAGKSVGIWGYGLEGSAAADAVADLADRLIIVDEKAVGIRTLHPSAGEVLRGTEYLSELFHCDVVLVSPGVPRTHEFLAELVNADVPTVSGADLWLHDNAPRTIGVTGTKGKSTTASLIHHLLGSIGIDSVLAGNIGVPLLSVPDDGRVVVAELSSYQCAWLTVSPRTVVVTNLYEEHIPWHGSLRAYWGAKRRLVDLGAETLVCDTDTMRKLSHLGPIPVGVSTQVFDDAVGWVKIAGSRLDIDALPRLATLPGRHNAHNVKAAVIATYHCARASFDVLRIKQALQSFESLAHRLQTVTVVDDVTWVDDCLSTTPESVVAAIQAFSPQPVVAIVGGQSRGVSYKPLNDYLRANASTVHVVAIPTDGWSMISEFADNFPDRVRRAGELTEAVEVARALATPGSWVVLSPGAPSFDLYRNYEDKASHFREAIRSQLGTV